MDLEKLAEEFSDSKEIRGCSHWSGLRIGFIAGYRSALAEKPTSETGKALDLLEVSPSSYEDMTDDELNEAEHSQLNEHSALDYTIRKIQNEQFYRKYPECRPH